MSNSYPLISTGNTFGNWVVTTNALVQENNNFDSSDYHKNKGTLYLDEASTSLQANGVSIFNDYVHAQGVRGAQVDYNFTVLGQVTLSNTSLSLTANGQANMNGLLIAQGPGTSLLVANNANVKGNLSVVGNTAIGNNLTITYNTTSGNVLSLGTTITVGNTFTNGVQSNVFVNTSLLTVTGASYTNTLQANSSMNTATLTVTGTSYSDKVQGNTSVNTATLSVTGTSYTNVLQSNTSVNTASLSVTGTTYTNVLQGNTSINTATLSVTGTSYSDKVQGNTSVNTATLSVTGTSYSDKVQGNTSVNTATLSVTGISYTNILQANTSANTGTLSVTGTSYANIIQGNTSVNTATLSVTGTSYVNVVQANTLVNTATLSVTGTSYTNVLQGNTSVNTATLSVTGTSYTNVLQSNTSVNTATLSVTGTSYSDKVQGNTSVNTATLSVTGTSYSDKVQANTSVNTVTLSVTSTTYTNVLQANTSANTATLSVTGTSYSDKVQGNTSVNTATLSVTGTSYSDKVQANTSINTATLFVSGISYSDKKQANTSVNTATLTVTGNAYANIVQANSSINTANLTVSNNIYTNNLNVSGNSCTTFNQTIGGNQSITGTLSVTGHTTLEGVTSTGATGTGNLVYSCSPTLTGTAIIPNATVSGSLGSATATGSFNTITANSLTLTGAAGLSSCCGSIGLGGLTVTGPLSACGTFTINGATIYNSASLTLGVCTANQNVTLNGYRNPGPNAAIQWNQASNVWTVLDVNNSNYYRILSDEYLCGSSSLQNALTIATSYALANANTFLQSTIATNLATAKSYTDTANTFLQSYSYPKTGGLISGDVNITGNLYVSGTQTFVNTSTLQTTDSLIELAANNVSDTIDIGFYGQYGSSGTKYTGLVRTSGSNYTLFQGVTTNPTSNSLTTLSLGNFATLNANLTGGTVTSLASPIAYGSGGTGSTSYTTGQILIAGSSGLQSLANVTSYSATGSSTVIPVITTDVYGRVTSLSTASISTTLSTSGTNGTGSVALASQTLQVTSNASSVIQTTVSSNTVTINSIPSGVTAGSYGNASCHPVFTVDAYGRITTVSNCAISIPSGSVSGLAASATTDTTCATNITCGTLAYARLPAFYFGTTPVQCTSTNQALIGISSLTGGTGTTDLLITSAATTSTISGILYLRTGDVTASSGNYSSGGISLNSGAGYGTGAGGSVSVYAGNGGAASVTGGDVTVQGGGAKAATSTGGSVVIWGGSALSTATTAATGGNAYIHGGRTYNASGTKLGGSVYIEGGNDFFTTGYCSTAGAVNLGTNLSSYLGTGTSAVNIGSSSITTTINGTVKLPNVATSGVAKFGAGGLLSGSTIVDADISSSAAISTSKISGLVASATTDTTNASNITSGTLNASRLPSTIVTPGSYGCVCGFAASAIVCVPSFTVDGAGRLTSAGECQLRNQPTLIGNSGTGYFDAIGISANPTWCFPGSNGVTTTVSTNKVAITIPQCIATTSCPTFAGLCSTNTINATLNCFPFYPLNLTNCCSYAASFISNRGITIACNDSTGGTDYKPLQITTGSSSFSIQVSTACACFTTVGSNISLTINGVYYGNGAGLTCVPAANVTGTLNSSVALSSCQITNALTYTPAPCVPSGSNGCILKGNASGGFSNATGADVVTLLSTCNITVGTICSCAITSSGSISLGTYTSLGSVSTDSQLSASYNLKILTNNNGGGTKTFCFDTSGNFIAPCNITAFSDCRLKCNITTLSGALSTVNALRGVSYEKDGQCGVGVIAQEVQQVLPEVVHESDDEDKTLSVAYGNISGVLIEAIKELTAQVNELKAEIEELKKR
jgi:hypothetical protein